MELFEILSREKKETNYAFIYREDEDWYAYEHSALLMQKLLADVVKLGQFVDKTNRLCLCKTQIDFDYLVECPILLCSDSELVIDCSLLR